MPYNAVYARQSADKKDSISIESQIDFCKYELKGEEYKTYIDRGYSGKNTERPSFQLLMEDIRRHEIKRVFVYKLDRISRSILDFTNMMNEFQSYGVEFISSTEKFDTSTPMGRAMLNICVVFAQLERETIQKRLVDSVHARMLKGFRLGGKVPLGFKTSLAKVHGVTTSMFTPDADTIPVIKKIFELYEKPGMSYKKVIDQIGGDNAPVTRNGLVFLLINPIYVQADLNVYRFFQARGVNIISPPEEFTGEHGCYLYKSKESTHSAHLFKGMSLAIAPSAGIIPSSRWIACRNKILANPLYQSGRSIKSWLVGKIYCGKCGARMKIVKKRTYCSSKNNQKGCQGLNHGVLIEEVEAEAYKVLKEKLTPFLNVSDAEPVVSPEVNKLKIDLGKVEQEIDILISSLTQATPTLIAYANKKIEELDRERLMLERRIREKEAEVIPQQDRITVAHMLGQWDELSNEVKRQIASTVLDSVVFNDDEQVEYRWKI